MINAYFIELNRLPVVLPLGTFRCEFFNWSSVGADWWKANGWRNHRHKHSFYEITYVWQGDGWFDIRDARYELHAGDLFIAKPTEIHEIISSQHNPLEMYFWSHTLMPAVTPETGFSPELLNAYIHSQKWVSTHDNNVPGLLNLLADELLRRQPGYFEAIHALATQLLLETIRAVIDDSQVNVKNPVTLRDPHDATIQVIVQYLRDNYAQPISIQDVAAQVYLSERHTSRLFKMHTGISIVHYLTSLRLETAAQLLMDTHLSIAEIAEQCGYANTEYFTALFRRRMGVVPTHYRTQGGTTFITTG